MKASFLLLGLLVFAPVGHAQVSTGVPVNGAPAESVLNLFIADNAYQRVQWQRDIKLVPTLATPAAGRQLGVSEFCGTYEFRPVTWGELTSDERKELLSDPALLSWIAWFSGKSKPVSRVSFSPAEQATLRLKRDPLARLVKADPVKPESLNVEAQADYGKYEFTITPENMVSSGDISLKLSPMPKTLPQLPELPTPPTSNTESVKAQPIPSKL